MRLTTRGSRRLFVLLVVVVSIATAAVAFWAFRDVYRSKLARQSRETGMAAYERGEYDTALGELSYALSRNSDDIEALLAFADSRSRVVEVNRRHIVSAVRYYETVLKLEPKNLEALVGILRLERRLGYLLELDTIADRILALNPDHIEALAAKAAVAFHDSSFEQVIDFARRLSAIEPHELRWRAIHIRALQAQDAGADAVLALCANWISQDEQDEGLRLVKVQALVEYGLLGGARNELREAVALGTDSPQILRMMMNLLDLLHLQQEADQLLVVTKSKHPEKPWVFEAAIRRHWQGMRLNEAQTELAEAQKVIKVPDVELMRWKALVHAARGEWEQASQTLDQLVEFADEREPAMRDSVRGWAVAIRARLHMSVLDRLEGINAYERALALAPNDPILEYLLAEAYQQIGEHDLAVLSLRRAARLDPYWISIPLAEARSLVALDRPADALALLGQVIRRAPNLNLGVYLRLARAWIDSEESGQISRSPDRPGRDRADVLELLLSLYGKFPQDAKLISLLTEVYARRGAAAEARSLIEDVLRDHQLDARALTLLAEASSRWDLDLEDRLINRARQLPDLTIELAGRLSLVLMRRGRTDDAHGILDEAVAAAPDRRRAEVVAAKRRLQLMFAAGDEDALAGLAQLLRDEPNSLAAAEFTLGRPEAWEDPALIKTAIDVLNEQVGERSPRALLAEATYRYRFQRDDAASIAHATGLVRDVLQRTPDSKHALTLMASLLLVGQNPRPERAIQHLKRVINLHPSDVTLYPRLISLLQKVGDSGEAGEYLKRLASRSQHDPAIRRAELRLLLKQGDLESSIDRIIQLVDETSDESEQLVLASLHVRAGDYADAEQIYTRLLASSQRSEMVVRRGADFYAQTGRFHKGLALLEALEIDGDSASKLLLLGSFHQDHGDLDESGRFFHRAVEISPGSTEAWNRLAVHSLAIGRPDDARQAALRGLEVDSKNEALLTTLAIASISTNGTTRKEDLQLIKNLGREHEPLRAMLRLLVQAKDDRGALAPTARDLADAQQLVRDYPMFLPGWDLAVRMHLQLGRVDEAVGLANRAAARLPNNPRPAEWAARMLFDAGRLDESLYEARTWRRRSLVRVIEPDAFIALVHLELGSPASAVKQLAPYVDRIWDERERFPDRVMLWLRALLVDGQIDRAESMIQRLTSETQRWHSQLLALALVLEDNSCYELLELIEPVLTQTPEGTVMLAKAWADLARRVDEPTYYERADSLADAAESAGAPIVQVHLLRAIIASYRGDLPATELHYGKVLELQPRHVVALNNLAYALIQFGGKYNEAAALALRAIKIDPGNSGVRDTYAQALIGLDRFDEAERNARLAVSARPDDPDLRLTLVECLIGQSRFDDTEAELAVARRAAAKGPGPDEAVAARIEQLQQRLDRARPVVEQRATTIGMSQR